MCCQSTLSTTILAVSYDNWTCKCCIGSIPSRERFADAAHFRYGFHKVNKSPRGHRGLAENQIWEFSHPKFVRGRPDLLDEIKRKALEQEVVRRDTGDINTHMTVMQVAQSDMMQQLVNLQENFSEIVRELADTRRRQQVQQQMLKQMLDYLTHQQGAQCTYLLFVKEEIRLRWELIGVHCLRVSSHIVQIPPEFNMDGYQVKTEPEQPPPPIYITSPDVHGSAHQLQNMFLGTQPNHTSPSPSPPPQPHTPPHQDLASSLPTRPAFPLTVQTQNLQNTSRLHTNGHSNFNVEQQHSPISPSQLSPNQMYAAMNTPLPPSPSPNSFLSDDEAASLYSPHSPNTPNVMTNASSNNSSTHLAAIDAFNFQQQHSQSLSPSGLTQQQQAADMFGYHMQSGAG